jgi:hypothetical protein
VISRWCVNYDGTSVGLRGGTWSYGGGDLTMLLPMPDIGSKLGSTAGCAVRAPGVRRQSSVETP